MSSKPDFYVYTQAPDNNDAPLIRIGAAWNHAKGDGMNVVLVATPVSGRLVLFPPKDDGGESEQPEPSKKTRS